MMVTKVEEGIVRRLERLIDTCGVGDLDYLSLVQKLNLRHSDNVLQHGISILNDPKKRSSAGGEEWTLYEQVAISSIDCHNHNIARDCIKALRKKFPKSNRVDRLEGMLLEGKGSWEEAEKAYSSILEENPFDQVVHKRRVAMARAQGNIVGAIELLSKYLEIFMADEDGWRELAQAYVYMQMYKQAAFCYEELILSHPTFSLYHLSYADVLYTMGGLENLQTAKRYYGSSAELSGGKNMRALYGIFFCTAAITQLSKGRIKDDKADGGLVGAAASVLVEEYKQKCPDKLILLQGLFKGMKLPI